MTDYDVLLMNVLVSQKRYVVTVLVIIFLLSFFAYSNTFNGEFQFDDDTSILENSNVTDISKFSALNFIKNPTTGRPVTTFTFALNYWFGGADVRWYHITNFIIHILNGALVFYFVFLTMHSPKLLAPDRRRALPVALISAAIFLLHPIQTQAVSYISQRYESLASLFYLCSLIAYIKARLLNQVSGVRCQVSEVSRSDPQRRPVSGSQKSEVRSQKLKLKTQNSELRTHRLKPAATRYTLYAVSIISGILAIGSKEIAITLPVIILLYDFYFLEDRPFFKRVAAPGIFIVLSLIIGMFMIAHGGRDAGFSVKAFTPWEYLMTQFKALTTYIRLLFLPINQNLDYDFRVSKSFLETGAAMSFIFLLFLIIIAIASFKKWRLGSFFILWFFIILAPTSSIIPIIDPIFEHRVYLASAGIFIVVSDVLSRLILSKKPPIPPLLKGGISEVFPSLEKRGRGDFTGEKYNRIAVCTVIILMVLLTGATFQRNRVWDTKLSLWEDAVKKSPMKSRAHNNLGNCYMLLDRYFEAIEEYKKAVALDKNNIEAYYNLGINLDNVGLLNQAVYYYDIFYKIAPAQYDKQKRIVRERIDSIDNEMRRTVQ